MTEATLLTDDKVATLIDGNRKVLGLFALDDSYPDEIKKFILDNNIHVTNINTEGPVLKISKLWEGWN